MKLLSQTHSPFARKVVVLIHELGLDNIQIEHHETSPTNPNAGILSANPLGKVPVLITDDQEPIYDSSVICDFLCSLAGKTSLLPPSLDLRARALRQQALAAGMCDAGTAVRWETERRPEELRYPKLRDAQLAKLTASYAYLEENVPEKDEVTVGTIALASALEWLVFRELDRCAPDCPKLKEWLSVFAARASMQDSRFEGATHD